MFLIEAKLIYFITKGMFSVSRTLGYLTMSIFYVQVVGLNPLQLVLVGTALELTCFLFEIPTGVVADTFSRKLSVIIGFGLLGISMVLQGVMPWFVAIMLMQVVAGIGWTFISGALEAWVADEVGEESAGKLYLRAHQVGAACGLVATLIAVGLATIQLYLPIVVGGGLMIGLSLLLVFCMPEKGFKPTPREERNSWQAMGHTFGEGVKLVRYSQFTIIILIIGVVFGAFSEGYDRLWEAHFLKDIGFPEIPNLNPVVWFGVISVGATLLGLALTEWIRRKLDTDNHKAVARTLLIINCLLVIGVVTFGLAGNFALAVGTVWAISLLRQLYTPLYTTWLNQKVNPQVRATVLSMGGQADALGQFMGGPFIGLIGTLVSINAAIAISGLMLAPVLLLYSRTLRQKQVVPLAPELETALPEK